MNIWENAKKTSSFQNGLNIIGFEFDGTACFRKGARLGPNAIREAYLGIETYSPYFNMDLEEKEIFDLGNLCLGEDENVDKQWKNATDQFFKLAASGLAQKKILTLGGEHSISYAPITSYLSEYKDLVLLHLDAHADLRDGYEGHHYSHASIIKRALEHFGDDHLLLQYGIRSGTNEEFEFMKKMNSKYESLNSFLEKVTHIENTRPIYLTLDLDYFDPAFLAGTGTPEPGGETFHSFISLMKILKNKNFVGCDVVELAPNIDLTGNSSVFAAKVCREILIVLGESSYGMDN